MCYKLLNETIFLSALLKVLIARVSDRVLLVPKSIFEPSCPNCDDFLRFERHKLG